MYNDVLEWILFLHLIIFSYFRQNFRLFSVYTRFPPYFLQITLKRRCISLFRMFKIRGRCIKLIYFFVIGLEILQTFLLLFKLYV